MTKKNFHKSIIFEVRYLIPANISIYGGFKSSNFCEGIFDGMEYFTLNNYYLFMEV